MLTLAPAKYQRVTAAEGGPLREIECGPISVLGARWYQANAYLSERVRTWRRSAVLSGEADGTGTAESVQEARHRAISEALERWAHQVTHQGPERGRYGFDVDPSSNGMAAFPGWWRRQARRRARLEAVERYCLIGWWAGALNAEPRSSGWPEVEAWQLENPLGRDVVVVVHALADRGVHAYGFAAGATFAEAVQRAAIEMVRAQYVLRTHLRRRGPGASGDAAGWFEQRCLYFSTEVGHAAFRERLARKRWLQLTPSVVFDGEIPGPWSEYTCVWRVVITPATRAFLEPTEKFFFW